MWIGCVTVLHEIVGVTSRIFKGRKFKTGNPIPFLTECPILPLRDCSQSLTKSLFAITYNGKSFAIAFPFFLFVLPSPVFGRTDKGFFGNILYFLPWKHVIRIGLVSLDTLANVSLVICLLLLKTRVTHNVPCALEKINNGGIKWACKCYQCFYM